MQFGSDNQAGISAQVLEAITAANTGHAHAYGDDQWTEKAVQAIKEIFECEAEVFFVATGTAANSLALSCMVHPWETVLCHQQAHIFTDESTGPEFFTGGARLVPISQGTGKLTAGHVEQHFREGGADAPHNPRAGALSIAQISEIGLAYTPAEIAQLTAAAHAQGLHVHMDGARFANALAALDCTAAELTWKSGIDVLCLGATKGGALAAEAVIFFKRELAETFVHRRKRAGHMLSKARFPAAQFSGWLHNDHWLQLARHANAQAARLAEGLASVDGVEVVWPALANEVFVTLPQALADKLTAAGAEFYSWYPSALPPGVELGDEEVFVRLVTSFATQEEQVTKFLTLARNFIRAS